MYSADKSNEMLNETIKTFRKITDGCSKAIEKFNKFLAEILFIEAHQACLSSNIEIEENTISIELTVFCMTSAGAARQPVTEVQLDCDNVESEIVEKLITEALEKQLSQKNSPLMFTLASLKLMESEVLSSDQEIDLPE